MERIISLQALRFIAAFMVVQAHALVVMRRADLPSSIIDQGQLSFAGAGGVDIFFVLSGAIMYLVGRDAKAGEFMRRRVIRIVPFYYLVSTVYVALAFLLLHQIPHPQEVLTTLTFWGVWDARFTTPVIVIGWTLCFEMLFYGAFALTLWNRRLLWPLLALYGGLLAIQFQSSHAAVKFLGSPMILEFLAGIAVMKWGPRFQGPPWFWLGLATIGATGLFAPVFPGGLYQLGQTIDGTNAGFRAILLGVPAVALVLAVVKLEVYFRGEFAGALATLGDASYSLYLTHWPLFFVLGQCMPRGWTFEVGVVVSIGLALLVAWLAYALIERPLVGALRRRRRPIAMLPSVRLGPHSNKTGDSVHG